MKKRIVSIILLLLLTANMTAFAQTSYTDVKESDYFYVEVLFTTGKGIINGTDDNKFKPYDTLTVAECIKISACIHANYYKKDITPHENPSHWADCYYDYAIENGIIKEYEFLKSDFDNAIMRDRLFYIFANILPDSEYIGINEAKYAPQKPMSDYVEKLFCAGIITGTENGFELENNITRADTVILISRMCAYSRRRIAPEYAIE